MVRQLHENLVNLQQRYRRPVTVRNCHASKRKMVQEFRNSSRFAFALIPATSRIAALPRALKYLIQIVAVGAAYYFLARFCRELVSIYPGAAAIWLPAGFALAAVLLAGYRVVPAIFAAAYAANAVSWDPDYATATVAAGHALAAFAGGLLVNWWAGGRNVFAEPAGVGKFVLIAVIAAAIGAGVSTGVDLGVGVAAPIGQTEWARFAATWAPRWLSDLAALLLITPVLVLWATDYPRELDLP